MKKVGQLRKMNGQFFIRLLFGIKSQLVINLERFLRSLLISKNSTTSIDDLICLTLRSATTDSY